MSSYTSNNDHPSRNEIIELIASSFPKIDQEDVPSIPGQFARLSANELRIVLHYGTKVSKKGRRILTAYLRIAPAVYVLCGSENFDKWIRSSEKVAQLNIFCLEGFFESSPSILEHGDMELLDKWAQLGMDLATKNKNIAIAYFKNSETVLISSSPDRFEKMVAIGKELGDLNVQVAESYFENLPGLQDVLSFEELELFYNIIQKILPDNWTIAVEILEKSGDVFSSAPPGRNEQILRSMDMITEQGSLQTLALFRNAPRMTTILDKRSFYEWTEIACSIAKIGKDASVTFLDLSAEVLDVLKLKEVEGWMDKCTDSLSLNADALERFIYAAFTGFAKYKASSQKEERSYLIDEGIRLALIDPDYLKAYFEYAPEVFALLTESRFNEWMRLGEEIARKSSVFVSGYYRNSVTVFKRLAGPAHGEILATADMLLEKDWLLTGLFMDNLPDVIRKLETQKIRKWAGIGVKIYELDKRFAADYFASSPQLLSDLDIEELEEWALKGLLVSQENPLIGRPYFSLRSKVSKDFVAELTGSVALKKVSKVLHYYGLGLSGINFTIRSRKILQVGEKTDHINPVVDGTTIYLAPKMNIYSDQENNFKIYKLSIMHEIGHRKFSSVRVALHDVSILLQHISKNYPNKEYNAMEYSSKEYNSREYNVIAPNLQYSTQQEGIETIGIKDIVSMFPNPVAAGNILGIIEDARIEYMVMDRYRGVRRELDSVRREMLSARPVPVGHIAAFLDTLLWLSTGHEPGFKLMEINGEMNEEMDGKMDGKMDRSIAESMRILLRDGIFKDHTSICDSLEVALKIYELMDKHLGPLESRDYEFFRNIDYRGVSISSFAHQDVSHSKERNSVIQNFIPGKYDSSEERVNEKSPEEIKSMPAEAGEKKEKQAAYAMDKNWKILGTYRYDEWDFVINDYKSEWCTVNEIEPVGGTPGYYDITTEHYRNEIALIKRIFSIMKPVDFQKLKQQIDGSEIDIDTFIDSLMEKKCGINPDDRLYVRWDKQMRDVATLFLVDVSASTRKTLGEEKRSIIDVEKDALIIMTHALESIGDKYAINAFSGHDRGGIEYFVVKGFEEEMSADVARRISILEPVSNTRLGSAIRHSISKLEEVKAKTKIIILLSDGEPYDTCKGESAYQGHFAEEDTRIAIQEVNAKGMHLFCITVDSSPGDYLENIFSDVGYTILDDARKLPETLPLLYKKITT